MNLKQSRLRPLRVRHKGVNAPAVDWPKSLHQYFPLQISFQPSNRVWRALVLLACANLAPLLFPSNVYCDPYASTWAAGPKSSVRLIAAGGGPQQGFYRAAMEIRLDPGALTYWRMPGGAGVPPVFSFEGSENAAGIAVSYPAPTRMDEDGTEAFGYRGGVTFPLHVTPMDPSRPVLLAVNLSYAVCDRICLPAKAEAKLRLSQDLEAGPEGAAIAVAEAAVPVRLTPQQRDAKLAIARDKGADSPAWLLSMRGEDPELGNVQDLFVEGPLGWYFETRTSDRPGAFSIIAAEKPAADSQTSIPVTLTLKGERRSYEFAVDLDAASPQ